MPNSNQEQSTTVFERVWLRTEEHLFRSERHKVMAAADPFLRIPLQAVIALSMGTPGREQHFADLPRHSKRILHEVADAVEEKLAGISGEEQRVITHTEGFGVPDHAHIVLGIAERKQGEALYNGSPLGRIAFEQTIELVRFNALESSLLEARLDEVR